jgi:hypothetical protein
MICFDLLSMRLFLSNDPGHEFDWFNLSWLGIFLCLVLIDFFFQFYLLILYWLGIIIHDLFLMRMSLFHDSGHEFDCLTRVDSNYFLFNFFKIIFFNTKLIENWTFKYELTPTHIYFFTIKIPKLNKT